MAPSRESRRQARVERGLDATPWRHSSVELPMELGEWLTDEVARRKEDGDAQASKNGIIREALQRERKRVERKVARRKTLA